MEAFSFQNSEPRTWTFEPDEDVKQALSRAITKEARRLGKRRGLRSKLINEALRTRFVRPADQRKVLQPVDLQ